MSFLKSYYNSLSSFVIGLDKMGDNIDKDVTEDNVKQCEEGEYRSDHWLSGVYYGVYNNSGEMWNAVKTDLSEFATILSKDAEIAIVKTAKGLKSGIYGDGDNINNDGYDYYNSTTSKIKASLNRILDQVSKTLNIPPDSEEDEDLYWRDNTGSQNLFARIEARVTHLQNDVNTFTTDPVTAEFDVDLGDFIEWKNAVNLDDFQSTIAELVKNNERLLDIFTKLVPDTVKFDDFWTRYFYRVASVKGDESRREAKRLVTFEEEHQRVNEEDHGVDVANDISADKDSSTNKSTTYIENRLVITESDDIIVVKHIGSPSVFDDRNTKDSTTESEEFDVYAGWEEDDIDIADEDIQLAKKTSEKDISELQWEDVT